MRNIPVKQNNSSDPAVGKLEDFEFNSIYDELKTLATQNGLVSLNGSSVTQLYDSVVNTIKTLTGFGISGQNAKTVPSSNLNNITESGVYRCLATTTNAPTGQDASVLALVVSSTQSVQIASPVATPDTLYVRSNTSGTFTSWFSINSSQLYGLNSSNSPNYGANLNLYKLSGIYTVADNITGAPTTLTGVCFVLRPTDTSMVQMFITTSTIDDVQSETYVRFCNGGTGAVNSAPTNLEVWRKVMYLSDVTSYVNSLGLGVTSLTAVADLNALATSGMTTTNDATTNKPTATGVYTVTTQVGTTTNHRTQMATLTGTVGTVYVREMVSGTWGAWVLLSSNVMPLSPVITTNTSVNYPSGTYLRYNLVGGGVSVTLPLNPIEGTKYTFINSQVGRLKGSLINRLTLLPQSPNTIELDTEAILDIFIPSFSLFFSSNNWTLLEA